MARPARISAWGRSLLAVLLLTLCGLPQSWAQKAVRLDTTVFRPTQLIAPGALIVSGIAIHGLAHESWDVSVREGMQNWRAKGGEVPFYEEILRYMPAVPLIVDLGLGLTGVPAVHNLHDRFIEAGLASALVGGSALILKKIIVSPRPDGSDMHSFPSGHSCISFMGAELIRMEYGWGWGAGAYAVAGTVAFLRLYHDRHWLSDLLLGAGIGILGAHVGRWLLDPTKRLLNIVTGPGESVKAAPEVSVVPSYDPFSGSFGTTLAFRF